MAEPWRGFKEEWRRATVVEEDRKRRLAEAKPKGKISYLRELIDFPWEQAAHRRRLFPDNPTPATAFQPEGAIIRQPSPSPSSVVVGGTPDNVDYSGIDGMSMTRGYPQSTPAVPTPTPIPSPSMAPPTPTPMPGASPGFAGKADYTNYLKLIAGNGRRHVTIPPDLAKGIDAASTKYGIPRDYLAGLAYHEGGGFNNIPQRGGGGGRGYFQIDSGYHPDISDAQAYDPVFAADYAGRLIDEGLRIGGSPEDALRYYNGGARGTSTYKPKDKADKKRAKAVQKNTKAYVDKVKRVHRDIDFD